MTSALIAAAVYDAALGAWRETCHHPETPYAMPVAEGCTGCETYMAACEAFLKSVREQNATDACGDFYPASCEALCVVCGQSFIPHGDADLIHLMTTVPPGVKWGDASTYRHAGVRLRSLPDGRIAALAEGLGGAHTTAVARRVIADYTGVLPDGPERYCGGRGELGRLTRLTPAAAERP